MGETIVVKPGERVPLDGTVTGGQLLPGYRRPHRRVPAPGRERPGTMIISGCVNQTGLLRVQVTKPCGESTVSKHPGAGGERRRAKRPRAEALHHPLRPLLHPRRGHRGPGSSWPFICRPRAAGFRWHRWDDWIHRALIFLVISCPCALVISVPLSFFGGIGGASKCGILVKGGNYLEDLAKAEIVVFDKTGTLTKGSLRRHGSCSPRGRQRGGTPARAGRPGRAATPTTPSPAPCRRAWQGQLDESRRSPSVEETAGHGVQGDGGRHPRLRRATAS